MGLGTSFKGLVSGVKESLGFKGHDKIGNQVGQWLNNFTGQTDAFNRSTQAEWDFWKANNSYNDPLAQMKRYESAGLNPNLIYGSGSASAGNASGSAPSMSAAGAGALSTVLSLYNMFAQNNLLKAQGNLTSKNALNAKVQNSILWQKELEQRAKTHLAQYNADYAEQEYNKFRRTGKIPETYYRTGGMVGQFGAGLDRILPY